VATYHPSAVLRNTDLRAAVWEDLKRLKALLDQQS
jgi:uracil-DNA glycosylase family 4